MPAIAIVAAVGTVSAGAALGGVLGGIMIAGGVMSGLGAVTKNKTLMALGAVASLGAGIGSAMGLAEGANSLWNGAVGADSALAVTGKSFLDTGGSMSAIGDALGRNSGTTDGLVASKMGGAEAPVDVKGLGQGPTGMEKFSAGGDGSQQLLGSAPPAAPITPNAAPSFMRGAMPTSSMTAPGFDAATSQPAGLIGKFSNESDSFIGKSLAFIKDNPEAVKVGGGLISGAMGSYQQQQQQDAALQARADERKRFNDSITNQRFQRPTRG